LTGELPAAVPSGTRAAPAEPSPWRQTAATTLALASAAAGLILAAHHPLSPAVALAMFGLAATACARWPQAWLVGLPALLPVLALAPWSGWITFEELDLMVLAAAAGGYARRAFDLRQGRPPQRGEGSLLVWLVLALMAASLLVSLQRGAADAGGWVFGWTQGYREPMNGLRLAKPLFEALLLFPLWVSARRAAPERAPERLGLGLMLGLLGASLAALWERLAFTGLLNFASDYRTTALFWEMHVGGAAFDAFLVLTLPFAVNELLVSSTRPRWLAAAAVSVLAGYASLTTFSRAVYAAVPIGLILLLALLACRQPPRLALGAPGRWRGPAWALALGAGFALAATLAFPGSGYRGQLALLGALAVLLAQGPWLAAMGRRGWAAGLALGLVATSLALALGWLLPKGPYLLHATATLATLALVAWHRRPSGAAADPRAAPLALAGLMCAIGTAGAVASHWGGAPALRGMLPALALLGLPLLVAAMRPAAVWPATARWQAATLSALVLVGAAVGVSGGGAYMSERLGSSRGDLALRLQHWHDTVALLDPGAGLWLGHGLGRFPATFLTHAGSDQQVGDYRIRAEGGNQALVLSAGTTVRDWGEHFRVTQRVAPPVGATQLQLDVRSAAPVRLHFEVCRKHLLYDAGCLVGKAELPATGANWQRLRLPMEGAPLDRGAWYAPALIAFSVAVESKGGRVELDNLVLSGADGVNLLANGDFEQGMARWFFSSDRVHLPWHAKNMALNTLFDQGLVGLGLLTLLTLGALWRVTLGSARRHALAPPLAGALLGLAVVVLGDTVLDVPRIAFLFWFMVLLALTLRAPPRGARADFA